jgi:hypothetical protein
LILNSEHTNLTLGCQYDYTVTVFAFRESARLLQSTVGSVLSAVTGRCCIDVIVNGNAPLAKGFSELTDEFILSEGCRLRVFSIPFGDKANAWNHHIHELALRSKYFIYIDGYISISRQAIQFIIGPLETNSSFLASSGVPTVGLTARSTRKQMYLYGGFHGSFCCLTSETVSRLRRALIRIPVGIYRTDSTLGAFLSFGLNPVANEWDPKTRIAAAKNATWQLSPEYRSLVNRIKSYFKRLERQRIGYFENLAVRFLLLEQKTPLSEFPSSSLELFRTWSELAGLNMSDLIRDSKIQDKINERHVRLSTVKATDTQSSLILDIRYSALNNP